MPIVHKVFTAAQPQMICGQKWYSSSMTDSHHFTHKTSLFFSHRVTLSSMTSRIATTWAQIDSFIFFDASLPVISQIVLPQGGYYDSYADQVENPTDMIPFYSHNVWNCTLVEYIWRRRERNDPNPIWNLRHRGPESSRPWLNPQSCCQASESKSKETHSTFLCVSLGLVYFFVDCMWIRATNNV